MAIIARGGYYNAPFENFVECIKQEFPKRQDDGTFLSTFFSTSEAVEKCGGGDYPTTVKYLKKTEEKKKRTNGYLKSHKVGSRTIWENDEPDEQLVQLHSIPPSTCTDAGGYYDKLTDTCLLPRRELGGTLGIDARTCGEAGGFWDEQTRTCYFSKGKLF
jgi:hypothetical protein